MPGSCSAPAVNPSPETLTARLLTPFRRVRMEAEGGAAVVAAAGKRVSLGPGSRSILLLPAGQESLAVLSSAPETVLHVTFEGGGMLRFDGSVGERDLRTAAAASPVHFLALVAGPDGAVDLTWEFGDGERVEAAVALRGSAVLHGISRDIGPGWTVRLVAESAGTRAEALARA